MNQDTHKPPFFKLGFSKFLGFLSILVISAVTMMIPSVKGQVVYDYTMTLDGVDGNTRNWTDGAAWDPEGPPTTGSNVWIDVTQMTQKHVYLNTVDTDVTYTISNFQITMGGSYSLNLYNNDRNTGKASTLKITDTLYLSKGITRFRSDKFNSTPSTAGQLNIETKDLRMDSSAELQIGEGNAFYTHVSFTVTGKTRLEGNTDGTSTNTRIRIGQVVSGSDPHVDLGDVVFANNLSSGNLSGINLDGGTLQVRSLSSALTRDGTNPIYGRIGNYNNINTTPGGTLVIYGDAPLVPPSDPEITHVFAAQIMNNIHVQKTGTNLQIFTRDNTYYGGTTISNGILSIQNTTGSGLGVGAVVVDTILDNGDVVGAGTLAGNGIVRLQDGNFTTVKSGGTVAPGADESGVFHTLTFSNQDNGLGTSTILKMETGSNLDFRVDVDGNSDRIAFGYYSYDELGVQGLILQGGAIQVNVAGILGEGELYTLFSFRSGDAVSGSLVSSGLTGGLVAGSGFGGWTPTFHYDEAGFGGTGYITMTVTAIPEPSTMLLLGLAVMVVIGGLWRQKTHSKVFPDVSSFLITDC